MMRVTILSIHESLILKWHAVLTTL